MHWPHGCINPLHTEISSGNIKLYLMLYNPCADKAQVHAVEIPLHTNRRSLYFIWSIPLLLMTWLLVSPGHQQPRYWPRISGIFQNLHGKGYQSLLFQFHHTGGHVSQINTLRQRQDGRHFPDDNFIYIFLNEKAWILIMISPQFVP